MERTDGDSPALANLHPITVDKVRDFEKELEANFEADQYKLVREALYLMCEIHADQKDRPDGTPYVEHPLSVARNTLESLETPDFKIIIAALLHDSVEDQAAKLAAKGGASDGSAQERALQYIEKQFGSRASVIVANLTNPDFEAELTQRGKEITKDNKNKLYAAHVAEVIKEPDVLPIKLFDFAENALRLDQVSNPARRLKLTKKYAPVIDVFISRLGRGEHGLKQPIVDFLLAQLKETYAQMQAYMQNAY